MARTFKQIKLEMTTPFMANTTLAALYGFAVGADFEIEFSKVSIENFIFSIVASAILLLDQKFDTHDLEVKTIIREEKAHTAPWYRTKAKAFQYGFDLITDTDKYDNTGFTDEQIEDSKIIKYSAVTKNAGQLLIKIASETGGVLAPITAPQKEAFDAYIEEIADEGVNYIVINNLPDILLLNLQIFRDPLVLSDTGMSIANGKYPVEDALKEYMKELPFDGELVLAHLVDKLQKVEGVRIPNVVNAESQVIDVSTNAYKPAQPITVKTVPESGYFLPKHPTDSTKIAIIDYVV